MLAQEEDVIIRGRPGIPASEVEAKVMANTLPILFGTLFGFYLIYRLLK
jgi:hypothetical protein